MTTSDTRVRRRPAQATGLVIGDETFTVCLRDGRQIAVPYRCYPRLEKATLKQRSHFEVYAEGKMLSWPEIDEDIEVQHVVEGRIPVKGGKAVLAVAESRTAYGDRKRGRLRHVGSPR